MPTLSIIIVTYNTRDMTVDCLRTLTPTLAGIDAEIFVVDNASTDNTPAAIRREFPNVIIIQNDRNRGFGAANNQAMMQVNGRYLLLLNSDAFPKSGAVAALVAYLDQHPNVAVVAPQLHNADGTLQRSCYRFPSPWRSWAENLGLTSLFPNSRMFGDYRKWAHDREREVDWAIGACLLVRRSVVQDVGGFDERFFMYVEETDWQKCLRSRGYRIFFIPQAQVTHLAGASGRTAINHMALRSIDQYHRKHYGLPGLLSVRASMAAGGFIRGIFWRLCALFPVSHRTACRDKARLHFWIFYRQLTTWNLT